MVQFISGNPSFGEQLAASLGQGASSAISNFAEQMLEKRKRENILDLMSKIENQNISSSSNNSSSGKTSDSFLKAKMYAIAGQPELARTATEEAKLHEKMRSEEKKESRELAKPTLERGRELVESLPYKENALLAMEDAISSGNLGFFTLDNLAELTGLEGLRSPEGATFKTASKEFFLGNLSRVGSRGLNQMMEKVVLEMAPLIGRKTEANLAVAEILGVENDVSRKEAELINEIGEEFKEKHGYYPSNISYKVYKELRPFAEKRQKEALKKIEKIKQTYAPKTKEGILMYDRSGNLRRIPHKDIKDARSAGYRMP